MSTTAYLVRLKTPPKGTVCRSDKKPFTPGFGEEKVRLDGWGGWPTSAARAYASEVRGRPRLTFVAARAPGP